MLRLASELFQSNFCLVNSAPKVYASMRNSYNSIEKGT
jgi:hypothetical protein